MQQKDIFKNLNFNKKSTKPQHDFSCTIDQVHNFWTKLEEGTDLKKVEKVRIFVSDSNENPRAELIVLINFLKLAKLKFNIIKLRTKSFTFGQLPVLQLDNKFVGHSQFL